MPRNYHAAREHILKAMPGTTSEIIERSGYHRTTVERWLRSLRKGLPATNCVRIVDWRRPEVSGHFVPVYGAESGPDMVCPFKRSTPSEGWAKRKAKYGMETLRKQERERNRRLRKKREMQLMAFMGVNPLYVARSQK